MKKYIIGIFITLTIYSCDNKLDGKIETREQDKIYLVNTSKTKLFKFTVKATKVTNDSTYDYSTDVIELPPGDEKYLGARKETVIEQKPPFDPSKPFTAVAETTIVTQAPLHQDLIQYKYEVTGQLEMKIIEKPGKSTRSTN
jgi:hypothetical protein